jgi:hypothetical protein
MMNRAVRSMVMATRDRILVGGMKPILTDVANNNLMRRLIVISTGWRALQTLIIVFGICKDAESTPYACLDENNDQIGCKANSTGWDVPGPNPCTSCCDVRSCEM